MSSSFRPLHACHRDVIAVHSSHGRILFFSTPELEELDDLNFLVWNPIMNKEWELPVLLSPPGPYWDAAVVCAVGDGCSHLDCHFKVVVVGISEGRTFSCFYSSETDSWSDLIFVSGEGFCSMMWNVRVGSGSTLYFRFRRGSSHVEEIIKKYDLPTHQMSTITLECGVESGMDTLLITTEDGRLGFATISNSTLCLWLREQGRWAESRVIQLDALLPPEALEGKPWVPAFADTGAGVIFLRTRVGYFIVDLNSGRSKNVGLPLDLGHIAPYVSFCTPAPGTISTDEGPVAGVVVSTNDEPGAGVAVYTDEVLGDVGVSTYEGQGDVVVATDEGPGHVVVSTDEERSWHVKCIRSSNYKCKAF